MSDIHTAPHLDDSELLHLVDQDASAFELERWTRHVLECGECSARLRVLQRRATAFSLRVAEVQLPDGFALPRLPETAARQPRRRRATGQPHQRARALAAVLLLALPLVLVPPLRAWVADRLAAGVALLGGGAAGDSAAAPEARASSTIWFTPAAPTLVVEVEASQAVGELVVVGAEGREASLEVLDGAGETPLLAEAGVRILNGTGSQASYRLALPPSVQRVRVRVAGADRRDVFESEIREGVRVRLAP